MTGKPRLAILRDAQWQEGRAGAAAEFISDLQPPRAPAMQPWDLRIAYVVDPSGVLWHIGERRDGAIHD
ncbi:MAG TPA: hypothetical protein VK714_07100 [Myxococcota bacterium]|nr:hypothetical protein [Myxococcota bacterium]